MHTRPKGVEQGWSESWDDWSGPSSGWAGGWADDAWASWAEEPWEEARRQHKHCRFWVRFPRNFEHVALRPVNGARFGLPATLVRWLSTVLATSVSTLVRCECAVARRELRGGGVVLLIFGWVIFYIFYIFFYFFNFFYFFLFLGGRKRTLRVASHTCRKKTCRTTSGVPMSAGRLRSLRRRRLHLLRLLMLL